jgi:hypothetical protein
MLRFLVCAVLFSASPCFAQPVDAQAESDGAVVQEDADTQERSRDPFVISSDECGASRYSHLVGEGVQSLQPVILPPHANVFSGNNVAPTTLEYVPGRLNIVFDDAGRILSVGCS